MRPELSWSTAPPAIPHFASTRLLRYGTKRYEVNDHLGNVRASISDRRQFSSTIFDPVITDATDYFPFGAPNRTVSSSAGYRYGFNGKELDKSNEFGTANVYDYGFRIYNPSIGRFLSVDPLTRSYPELTPYQFASNTPIMAIDLDGLEAYFSTDGSYIGLIKGDPTVKVIKSEEMQGRDIKAIHNLVQKGTVESKTLPVYTETTKISTMKLDHLLDLAHIIYGESSGKESDKLAHLLFNREIEYSRLLRLTKVTPMGVDQKTGEKIYPSSSNNKLLKYVDMYGFKDYVLFGTYKPFDQTAIEDYKSTLRMTGIQYDGDDQNYQYLNFFKLKSNVGDLMKKIPVSKSIFKALIDARLGNTTDEFPNFESWKGEGGVTVPLNKERRVRSDQ